MGNMRRYFLLILMKLALFELTGASGVVSLKLTRYNNPGGKTDAGPCCESVFTWCGLTGPCDHYFIICLDEMDGNATNIDRCKVGRYRTGTIVDQNEIEFGDMIHSTPNPKETPFRTWLGGIRFKVKVYDNDYKGEVNVYDLGLAADDDFIEFLSTQVKMEPSKSRAEARWQVVKMKKRTELKMQMAVFCDENYYGLKCEVFCKPSARCKCNSDGKEHCDCGLAYYGSCDLTHSAPENVNIVGDHNVQTSAAGCFDLCETNRKSGCSALDIIRQINGSYKCVLMKQRGKSTCLTDPKVKHYVRDYFPKTCSINGTLADDCQGKYEFVGLMCNDEPVYEQTNGQRIIYHIRDVKWVCASVDSDMSACNAPEYVSTKGDRSTMAGSWGMDSYAVCY